MRRKTVSEERKSRGPNFRDLLSLHSFKLFTYSAKKVHLAKREFRTNSKHYVLISTNSIIWIAMSFTKEKKGKNLLNRKVIKNTVNTLIQYIIIII